MELLFGLLLLLGFSPEALEKNFVYILGYLFFSGVFIIAAVGLLIAGKTKPGVLVGLLPFIVPVLLLFYVLFSGSQAISTETKLNKEDPNRIGIMGTPILCEVTDIETARELIEYGADINIECFGGDNPAIHLALADEWIVVDYLLDTGSEIDRVSHTGMTLPYLAYASRVPHPDENTGAKPEYYHALNRVKDKIATAGIAHWKEYRPPEVQSMQEAGDWPPQE